MESANTGREQFMCGMGQLTEESNVFWGQELEGYHGLRSVNDIPRLALNGTIQNLQGMTKCEFDHYHSLMKHICPLVEDATCFLLISVIMLLDISNLIEDGVTPLDVFITSNTSIDPSEVRTPSLSDVFDDGDEITYSAAAYITDRKKHCETHGKKKSRMEERFHEINALQRHYIHLLRNRCMHLNNPKLRRLWDTDMGLKRTMVCLKQLAQYERVVLCEDNTIGS